MVQEKDSRDEDGTRPWKIVFEADKAEVEVERNSEEHKVDAKNEDHGVDHATINSVQSIADPSLVEGQEPGVILQVKRKTTVLSKYVNGTNDSSNLSTDTDM